jgi:hypothetical protein
MNRTFLLESLSRQVRAALAALLFLIVPLRGIAFADGCADGDTETGRSPVISNGIIVGWDVNCVGSTVRVPNSTDVMETICYTAYIPEVVDDGGDGDGEDCSITNSCL